MITEQRINTITDKLPKINKKQPPRSVNFDLTPLYFSALFVGAKNSGKTYGLVKMLHNYQQYKIYDSEGNELQQRIILFCPTANSNANPVYKTLKYLDDNDIILDYSDEKLLEILKTIEDTKTEIEEFQQYIKAYKLFEKADDVDLLNNDIILILSKYNFTDPKELPKPKYKFPPVIHMIFDDLIADPRAFKKNSAISNLLIKHRHYGINMIFTTQNPKSINNIIRSNIDVYILYKFANANMIIEKVYEEVSSFMTVEMFEEAYKFATTEAHNSLVVDTHPLTDRNKRIKKNFNSILIFK